MIIQPVNKIPFQSLTDQLRCLLGALPLLKLHLVKARAVIQCPNVGVRQRELQGAGGERTCGSILPRPGNDSLRYRDFLPVGCVGREALFLFVELGLYRGFDFLVKLRIGFERVLGSIPPLSELSAFVI